MQTDATWQNVSMGNIPTYLISYNRITVLKDTLESLIRFIPYQDIIIIDNGSDQQELLNFYDELRLKGVKVIKNKKIKQADDLNDLGDIIDEENRARDCKYYIVSDPDISLRDVSPDFLEICKYFLDHFEAIDIIGPMLKIIDIPANYPARELAWKKHTEQFWHKKPLVATVSDKKVYYQFATIDTSFGMLRSEKKFRRKLEGIRLYDPYEAYHLDWYITPENMTGDQEYYLRSMRKNKISHWSSKYLFQRIQRTLRNKDRGIYIVQNGEIVKFQLTKNNSMIARVYSEILEFTDSILLLAKKMKDRIIKRS